MRNAGNSISSPAASDSFSFRYSAGRPLLVSSFFFLRCLCIYLPARLNAVLPPGPPACRIIEVEVVIAVGR